MSLINKEEHEFKMPQRYLFLDYGGAKKIKIKCYRHAVTLEGDGLVFAVFEQKEKFKVGMRCSAGVDSYSYFDCELAHIIKERVAYFKILNKIPKTSDPTTDDFDVLN